MGDHRAECRISFNIHGKEYTLHLRWVNWSPDDDGIDSRVREFFRASWDDAFDRYEAQVAQWQWEEGRVAREKQERAEYERLKAKFEPPGDANE